MKEEKRRYQRYDNHTLSVDIARPGFQGIIRTNPTAACVNFSRTGMQFDCPQELNEGDKLVIDISIDDIDLQELKAVVISKVQSPSGDWCHGARFCLEEINQASVFHHLLQIEHHLMSQAETHESS